MSPLWEVRMDAEAIRFGSRSRRRLTHDGCNEPFMNAYWCPRRRWFGPKPCPFANRLECHNFMRMCGAL